MLLVALSVAAVCGPSDMHPEPTFPFLSAMPAESDSTGSSSVLESPHSVWKGWPSEKAWRKKPTECWNPRTSGSRTSGSTASPFHRCSLSLGLRLEEARLKTECI